MCSHTPIRAMFDYSDYYATLGATPDTNWETLRANYRRLIGQWHPDRFSDDPPSKRIAEERSKQITIAYQTLEKYRRDHGLLPSIEPAAGSRSAGEPAQKGVPTSDVSGLKVRAESGKTRASVREFAKGGRGPWRHAAIACSALITVLYLTHHYHDPGAPDNDRPEDTPQVTSVATPIPGPTRGISTGSTLGEVYSIQGVPTLTEGETWHYGKSQIRFAQGKVISWDEHPDNPLRIAGNPFIHSHERLFNIGSTKDEVRAIQGTPVTETDAVWDYAPSRVYFQHNRVIRWQESPLQPLRVPH
jgi:hypothetical protein